ncbi:hypothetical protein ACH5RR_034522 [Cinchona calisaya]|uniref:Uncharacterized protein n=1 Tax=Cinchona calisaya TaxID=153742 RepID=A0ABD2YB64_9GENT
MATASGAIAEAYMTKRTYEEKMKRMEKINEKAGDKKEADDADQSTNIANKSKNSSGGFFSGMFKKVHDSSTANFPSSDSSVQSLNAKN